MSVLSDTDVHSDEKFARKQTFLNKECLHTAGLKPGGSSVPGLPGQEPMRSVEIDIEK